MNAAEILNIPTEKIQDDRIEINGNDIPIGKTYKQELYKKLNIL